MVRASSFGTGWGDRQFDADVPPPEGEVEPTVVEELRTNSLNRVRVSSLMTMRSGPALPRGTLGLGRGRGGLTAGAALFAADPGRRMCRAISASQERSQVGVSHGRADRFA